VLEWIERETLREAREKGWLNGGDREVFEAQARAILEELPKEMRNALLLESDEIIVSRNAGGELDCSFLISPRHYFGVLGGAPARAPDHDQAIAGLVALFPRESANPPRVTFSPVDGVKPTTPSPRQEPTKLKSAEKGSGAGILWGLGILLVIVCGAAGWFFFQSGSAGDSGEDDLVAESQGKPEEPKLLPEVDESEEDPVPAVGLGEPSQVREDEQAVSDEVEGAIAANIEESSNEDDLEEEVFEEENFDEPELSSASVPLESETVEVGDLPEPEEAVTEKAEIFDPYDLEGLRARADEMVTLAAPVMAVEKSGGQGTLWYLDFGNTSRTAFVYFKHVDAREPGTWEEWQKFLDQDVEVTGVVDLERSRRGSEVAVVIESPEAVEVILPPRVFQYSEWRDLDDPAGAADEVLFEARYQGFLKREDVVYLLFDEGFEVAARFVVGGPLSNSSFLARMKELEGDRVRLSAPVVREPQGQIEYIFELADPASFKAAPSSQ
jgi:hypothetical protein